MVIDTSALAAILFAEADADEFEAAIVGDPVRLLSAASSVEIGIVVESRLGAAGAHELDLLVRRARVAVVPLDEDQAEIARNAWRRFGKGRHPAGLNLGDCFSYALSIASGEPLLFKGDDFTRTDVARARPG